MFILGHFLSALAYLVNAVLTVMYCLVFVRALLSWVSPDPFNPIVQFLQRATEPVLEPIRRLLPPLGIDLSPIIAFFGIQFLNMFLVRVLYDLAGRCR